MSILESEAEWKEVWKIYDLDKDGIITKEDFVSAIRVLGRRYTLEQMEEKLKKVHARVDFDTFIEFLHEPYDGPTKDDLKTALQAFDGRDAGALGKMDVSAMLTSMGDKLNEAEMKIVMGGLPLNAQGVITIDALADYFTPPVPSTKPNVPQIIRDLMLEELRRRELEEELSVASSLPSAAAMAVRAVETDGEGDDSSDGGQSPVPAPPPPPPDSDGDL